MKANTWQLPSCAALAELVGRLDAIPAARNERRYASYWTRPGLWLFCLELDEDESSELIHLVGDVVAGVGGWMVDCAPKDLAPDSQTGYEQQAGVTGDLARLRVCLEPWRLLEIRDSQ